VAAFTKGLTMVPPPLLFGRVEQKDRSEAEYREFPRKAFRCLPDRFDVVPE